LKEVFTMWKNVRMILLVALCAALYAAVLIAFKAGIVIIPGITEIRPANILPIAFSFLFGPAAAWGCAIGNLIGDFFGTLGPGSFFGFIGNFLLGYVPYKIWGHLGPISSQQEPEMRTVRQWIEFIIIGFISAAVCAVIIAWGLEVLGLVPFKVLSTIITSNNTAAHIVGGILLLLVWVRIKKIGLYWKDVMAEEDIAKPILPKIGSLLMLIGGVVGWIIGAFILPAGGAIIGVTALFIIAIIVAMFLL
jgi:energy-coupling factor transport system substrate-specific component